MSPELTSPQTNAPDQSARKHFNELFLVSRETEAKLACYAAMLEDWNTRINLVAASTLPDLWSRHFLDSAQLYPLLPSGTRKLVDFGSGAGFPGLVLSIMGVPEVHLVESVGKKARFLEAVITELGLNAKVHVERIESLAPLEADVVTARAVAPILTLMPWVKRHMTRHGVCLLLKGEKAEAELTAARKYWTFGLEKIPSQSDSRGIVLRLTEPKTGATHAARTHKYDRR